MISKKEERRIFKQKEYKKWRNRKISRYNQLINLGIDKKLAKILVILEDRIETLEQLEGIEFNLRKYKKSHRRIYDDIK